jgi:hypothetical protein
MNYGWDGRRVPRCRGERQSDTIVVKPWKEAVGRSWGERGRSAADVVGWTSGFDWRRVDKRIQVLGCWASWPTNGSVPWPGRPASGQTLEAFPVGS